MKKCVYCNQSNNVKMSREHVISKTVLQEAFGNPIRSIGRYNNMKFIDYEHVIKDVCVSCNSNLSRYDSEGRNFIKDIKPHYKPHYVKFPCNLLFINWLLKTHLNLLRIIKDAETQTYYNISQEIYKKIIQYEYPSESLLKLYIDGWDGAKYLWDINSGRNIQYFSYKSIRFKSQRIIVSYFRIKFIETFIFLPCLKDYTDFDRRVKSVLTEMKVYNGFDLQEIDLNNLGDKKIEICKTVPLSVIKQTIHKIED